MADTSAITVLADGARSIWEEQRKHLRDAEGVLDIFHVLEHVAQTGKVLHTDPQACEQWCNEARSRLLHDGYAGLEELVQQNFQTLDATEQPCINSLQDSLAPHQHHLDSNRRLAKGLSIGSGQIEGACKNLIGKRLQANAAKWRVRRGNQWPGCAPSWTPATGKTTGPPPKNQNAEIRYDTR
ncbi:MAG: hypothetical protein R3C02_24315 [Planctomycetaceae bacterium]